jgi:hypothetical protein
MDLKEVGFKAVEWIYLAQDRDLVHIFRITDCRPIGSTGRIIEKLESVCALIRVVSRRFPGEIEKNHDDPQSG